MTIATTPQTEPNPFLAGFEEALNAGNVWGAMRNGRFWRVRRNGATRRWRRDPSRWEIPIKAGLRSYATINQDSHIAAFGAGDWRSADFVISQGGFASKGSPAT